MTLSDVWDLQRCWKDYEDLERSNAWEAAKQESPQLAFAWAQFQTSKTVIETLLERLPTTDEEES